MMCSRYFAQVQRFFQKRTLLVCSSTTRVAFFVAHVHARAHSRSRTLPFFFAVHNDGTSSLLLLLEGTIPISYSGMVSAHLHRHAPPCTSTNPTVATRTQSHAHALFTVHLRTSPFPFSFLSSFLSPLSGLPYPYQLMDKQRLSAHTTNMLCRAHKRLVK